MGISTLTRLEVGYSARLASDVARAFATAPLAAMPVEYLTPAVGVLDDCGQVRVVARAAARLLRSAQ